jgi:mannose-6-phosphate isomerase-like protein (cupin superfamily)
MDSVVHSMREPVREPPFPGAVGVTHLRVYDSESPDGLRGGTPHLHLACTEAYIVVGGSGSVQTVTAHDGLTETPLEPGALVWFTPGTVHRLVNRGDLEIFVLMQNSGLPEAGDMVITFPSEVLDDPDAYRRAATLPPGEATTDGTGEAARVRRDLGVEGFHALLADLDARGDAALHALHRRAAAIVRPQLDAWRKVWADGPRAVADATERQLEALAAGSSSHLDAASVHALEPPRRPRRMGCCGTLGTYLP